MVNHVSQQLGPIHQTWPCLYALSKAVASKAVAPTIYIILSKSDSWEIAELRCVISVQEKFSSSNRCNSCV